MTKREMIENAVKEAGYTLGCYSKEVEKLTKDKIQKVCNNIEYNTTLYIESGKTLYVVSIESVDSEKDILCTTAIKYFRQYGELRLNEALECGDITQNQYERIYYSL